MDEKIKQSVTEMVILAAQSMGADPKDCVVRITNNTEPNSCDKQCSGCEGQTHHWMEGFKEDADGEIIEPDSPLWTCKHCDYSIPYGDSKNHPSGCDCPDCFDDSDCWLCSCGNFIENGLHCTVCNTQPPWGCPCNLCDYDGEDDEYWWCGSSPYDGVEYD